MSSTIHESVSSSPGAGRVLTRPLLIGLWLVALGLLLIAPGRVPVSRTQEARVLETARQMLGGTSAHPYLIPILNGQLRLQKPPLAYWLAAGSYHVLGVSAAAGRLPAILAGWGTIAVTYLAGAWLFGRRAGLLSAAALLSSYLFYRYTRLAETDTLAAFFVTASCLAFWRAMRLDGDARAKNRGILAFHIAAALAAGAALSKGPPAAFPVLFFVGFCLVNRDYGALKRFVMSGCLVTFALLATAWYAYLASHHLLTQVFHEIDDLAAGHDHGGSFLNYLPELLTSTAPWSGLFVAAVVFGVQRWKLDERVRGLMCWAVAIFLPLCCVGNKQFHYLFPLMPPLMLLVGALLEHVLSLPRQDVAIRPVRWVFLGTVVVTACAAVALPVTSHFMLHRMAAADFVLGALVLVASVIVWLRYRKGDLRAGVPAYAWAAALLMPLILSLWLPALVAGDFRPFAAGLRERFGDGPYAFFVVPKLPLNYELRQAAPFATNVRELRALAQRRPGTVAVIVTKHGAPAPQTPPGFAAEYSMVGRENDLYAYRLARDAANEGTR